MVSLSLCVGPIPDPGLGPDPILPDEAEGSLCLY